MSPGATIKPLSAAAVLSSLATVVQMALILGAVDPALLRTHKIINSTK
jgi:hypothetical protein